MHAWTKVIASILPFVDFTLKWKEKAKAKEGWMDSQPLCSISINIRLDLSLKCHQLASGKEAKKKEP